MNDAAYKAMTLENNKHIDTMAASIVTLADNVGTTNTKLENLVEVINTHNVLNERVANMHDNIEDFSKRIYTRLDKLEADADTNVSANTIRWGYGGTILAIIAFCSWLMLSNDTAHTSMIGQAHGIDNRVAVIEKTQNIVNTNFQRALDEHDDQIGHVEILLNRNYGIISNMSK